ncbi:hypothetical protein ACJX0J_025260, partial [Zea mays]
HVPKVLNEYDQIYKMAKTLAVARDIIEDCCNIMLYPHNWDLICMFNMWHHIIDSNMMMLELEEHVVFCDLASTIIAHHMNSFLLLLFEGVRVLLSIEFLPLLLICPLHSFSFLLPSLCDFELNVIIM